MTKGKVVITRMGMEWSSRVEKETTLGIVEENLRENIKNLKLDRELWKDRDVLWSVVPWSSLAASPRHLSIFS